jgi:pimeloyl-ACP methyl ester carboxylesterase
MSDEQFADMQTQTMAIMAKKIAARPTLLDWSLTSDRRVVAQAMYEVTLADARPRLSAIAAPVTVLYAWDADMGRPAAMVDQMYATPYAGLAAANLIRVDGSFHFIMIDQPEVFAEEVANFLR